MRGSALLLVVLLKQLFDSVFLIFAFLLGVRVNKGTASVTYLVSCEYRQSCRAVGQICGREHTHGNSV